LRLFLPRASLPRHEICREFKFGELGVVVAYSESFADSSHAGTVERHTHFVQSLICILLNLLLRRQR